MGKAFVIAMTIASASVLGFFAAAQSPPSPTPTPTPDLALGTPVPSPTPPFAPAPAASPTVNPSGSPMISIPSTAPSPSITPLARSAGGGAVDKNPEIPKGYDWSEKGAPVFTIDRAIVTALQQNPDVLRSKQEIERTHGIILQVAAQALPHVVPTAQLNFTDPALRGAAFSSGGGGGGGGGGGTGTSVTQWDYNIRVTGTQLVFNYGTFRQIRGTFFQRDAAYFAFRSTLDTVVATTTTQFYQVILNRALIGVQEESVRLLESQLRDQQNRFEAGTVPRFNVLQAQVQLSNQIPNLIAARNNYRISILQLAKTLGIDYNPQRGVAAPIRVVGELIYVPRTLNLLQAIELGKQGRAFLKQARANVMNQLEQVHVAIGGFLPNATSSGGYEVFSSPLSTSFSDVSRGWVFGLQGSWAIWDSGQTYGIVRQQRALLSESTITYDDDVRQVELEIQQAASNVLQNRELIQATEKTVEQADESVRLAKARLDAGAGTQLDVLNAQVQLTTAQSTRLQALFGYISSVAELDRSMGTQTTYIEAFDQGAPRATRSRRYYTGSDVDAFGKPKPANPLAPAPVMPMSQTPLSK